MKKRNRGSRFRIRIRFPDTKTNTKTPISWKTDTKTQKNIFGKTDTKMNTTKIIRKTKCETVFCIGRGRMGVYLRFWHCINRYGQCFEKYGYAKIPYIFTLFFSNMFYNKMFFETFCFASQINFNYRISITEFQVKIFD